MVAFRNDAVTPGQIAYASWHGISLPIQPEDWPENDKVVLRWEAVGAAVLEAQSKGAFGVKK